MNDVLESDTAGGTDETLSVLFRTTPAVVAAGQEHAPPVGASHQAQPNRHVFLIAAKSDVSAGGGGLAGGVQAGVHTLMDLAWVRRLQHRPNGRVTVIFPETTLGTIRC